MKINTKLTILLFALAAPVGAIAQESPGVKVSGLRVIRDAGGNEDDKLIPFNSFDLGTSLALLIDSSGKSIIKVDTDASKVESLTDDKGTNLLIARKGGFQNLGFDYNSRVSEDGKSALVQINGGGVPASGATKISAKGTVILQTASKKQTIKSKPFALTKGSKLTVGDIELTVKRAGKPGFGDDALAVEFETKDKAIELVAGVKFLSAAGSDLESQNAGTSRMGFNDRLTYGRSYLLKKPVKGKVILQVELWTDFAEKKVPFEITASVGG